MPKRCRFYRTTEVAWGDWVASVNGISVFLTIPQFKTYTLSKSQGGYGLVFDEKPPVKIIKAARLVLLGKGEKKFVYRDIYNDRGVDNGQRG